MTAGGGHPAHPKKLWRRVRRLGFPIRSRRAALLERFLTRPLRQLRHRGPVSPSAPRWPRLADGPRPRLLFVLQDAAGGVRETHQDLMSYLHPEWDCFVLFGSLHRLSLEHYDGAARRFTEVRTWWLSSPWSQRRIRSAEHREIYRQVLSHLAPDLLHVRHLLGHSFDLVELGDERRLPMVLSFHDFYMVCPGVHLLDGEGRYCGGHCTAGRSQCWLPMDWLGDLPVLRAGHRQQWVDEVARLLPRFDAFVTTSQAARQVIRSTYPRLPEDAVRVIEHGRDFEHSEASVAVAPEPGRPARILAAGNLGFHKGSRYLRRILDLDRQGSGRLELHLLGWAAPELEPVAVCHGPYPREHFPRLARDIAPSFAGIFSIWPETYCHTLTEAWSVGLPVLATDIGTLRERIGAHGGGWLLPADDPRQAYRRILEILADRPGYGRQVHAARIDGLPRVADMGRRYADLYRDLLAKASASSAVTT